MTSSIWPKFISLKKVFAQSARSRIDPTNITPTDKMTFAKARIWHEVIGGNVSTGLGRMKNPLQGQAKLRHFDYVFRNWYLNFQKPMDENYIALDDFRKLRELRQGKYKILQPSRTQWAIPKFNRKRYLHVREKRAKLAVEHKVMSPMMLDRVETRKREAEKELEIRRRLIGEEGLRALSAPPRTPPKAKGDKPEEKKAAEAAPKAEKAGEQKAEKK